MYFGSAIKAIQVATLSSKEGISHHKGIRLPQWSSEVIIRVQISDEKSKMTVPYFYVESRFGRVPWIPTMIEMFSTDWEFGSISSEQSFN